MLPLSRYSRTNIECRLLVLKRCTSLWYQQVKFRVLFMCYLSPCLSSTLGSSLAQATSIIVLLSSFVTSKMVCIFPVMDSHLTQHLPVEFSQILHGNFFPEKRVAIETTSAGISLKKLVAPSRRGLDTETTWSAHIHLYLTSLQQLRPTWSNPSSPYRVLGTLRKFIGWLFFHDQGLMMSKALILPSVLMVVRFMIIYRGAFVDI